MTNPARAYTKEELAEFRCVLSFLFEDCSNLKVGSKKDVAASVFRWLATVAELEKAINVEAEKWKLLYEEESLTRTMLGDILTKTVNALRGQPDSRSTHGWATIPQEVAEVKARVRELREALVAAEWGGVCINESEEEVGAACPNCGGLRDESKAYCEYRAGHRAGCTLARALANTREAEGSNG